MKQNPLVSILMATMNTAPYVEEAITSALSQTYSNIELVIVNDGSTDLTEERIKPYLEDKRVKYYSWGNQGVSKARNEALRFSKGEYITFLDGDDFYAKDKVEKEFQFLEAHPDYGAVYCRFYSFYDVSPKKLLKYGRNLPSGNILEPLLKWNLINPNTIMIRRQVFEGVGGFDPEFRDAEDWDLWLRMAQSGILIGHINEELHYNRLRLGSHSRFENQFKMKLSNLRSFERVFKNMSQEDRVKYEEKKIFRRIHLKLAAAYLVVADGGHLRKHLRAAWRGSLWMCVGYPCIAFSYVIPLWPLGRFLEKLWFLKQKWLLGG